MGHMSDDSPCNITVRWKNHDGTAETFQNVTNVDSNDDEVSFDDSNGHRHNFSGVAYHITELD